MSPQIQNPTLNTAECVSKGHTTDVSSVTGREFYIRMMLWSSFGFSFSFGPLLALITLIFGDCAKNHVKTPENEKKRNLTNAVKYTIFFLVFVQLGLFIYVLVLSIILEGPWDIIVILGVIILEALIVPFIAARSFDFLVEKSVGEKSFIFMWGNLSAFQCCWVVVGIMINTVWGFTVLLVISVILSSIVFAIYNFLQARARSGADNVKFMFICAISLFSVLSLVAVVILSGQAFFGRDSANELLKTALVYVITAFVSWIVSKVKTVDTEQG